MKRLLAVYDTMTMALVWLAGAIVLGMFILIVVDVTIRTLNHSPPAFTLAFIEYGLLYIAMLMAPYLLREKKHVYIDALIIRLPRRIRVIVEKIVYAGCTVTSLIFAGFSAQLLLEAIETGIFDERGVDMPLWALYAPLPLSFAMVAVEFFRLLCGSGTLYSDRTEARESV
ncbi:MAG: TRAP transporter small permease subunit [Proteobacteria bacterium]|nr:TRAP transporter small permease subunit [Pseudomonadota bacterium]